MKKIILLILILGFNLSYSQQNEGKSFLSYYQLSRYMPASPGSFKFGLYGFQNPAILNYNRSPFDALITANDFNGDIENFNDWGLFYGAQNSGFGALTTKRNGKGITDYRYSVGFGSQMFGLGVTYGFTGGDKGFFGRSNLLQYGALIRPNEYISVAASYLMALDNDDAEGVVEVAVRPIPKYPNLTLFADGAIFDDQNLKDDLRWSAGAIWEFIDGVRINGRYFSDEAVTIGVDISLGMQGISAHSGLAKNTAGDFDNSFNSFAYRFGGKDRTIFDNIVPMHKYAELDLSGTIKYQKNLWFDNSKSLLQIITKIDEAMKDKMISGIVINISEMQSNMSILWEIRTKLKDFRKTGKKVIVFFDRAGITNYHFASVADEIIIDQQGMMSLEGYVMGRSFYKNMFDKLNIGFEELRFFKYKSAVESYSREDYSEGSREQNQKLIDDWYETVRKEVSEDRDISPEEFDKLVNGSIGYMPQEAVDKKLADRTGRWTDKEDILKEIDSKFDGFVSLLNTMQIPEPIDDQWGGEKNQIAVIYALGECAMDQGIKARTLINDVKAAVEDDNIDAIVLRVDSPGGDALASDYISEVIRENKDKKPIIVSQGMVAASGGYWLSMYGDKILASPFTITGSIGVISGWMYDKGAADSLGITTDLVKRGEYADFGFSWALPFIGLGLPVRNMTENEKQQRKDMIMKLYEEFVNKVADGRGKTYDEIHEVAQGRVWTGSEGLKIGLVDEIGGLDRAIQIAKQEAGIKSNEFTNLLEYPKPQLFDFSGFLPSLIGMNIKTDNPELESLMFRIQNNGLPMPIMSLDYYNYVQSK